MRFIVSPSTDVYFNLAAESHFLHHTNENICMLWRSENAVVCGKHQNICAEINYAACRQLNIAPARRVSGGGTVYHDLGNINFTFIQDLGTTLDKAVNYKRFLEPIRQALAKMGIETSYSERDDLLFNGVKFSGNAQHIFQQKKRVLHHGTLLINANIHNLSNALHSQGSYQDKAVKSNKTSVTNLAQHFPELKNIPKTIQTLASLLTPILAAQPSNITADEVEKITLLKEEKFILPNWILGYSPTYTHQRKIVDHQNEILHLQMTVTKGFITAFQITQPNTQQSVYIVESARTVDQPISAATFERAFANTPFFNEALYNQFF